MASHQIRSPLPGVFYRKPSPEEANYKEVGDSIKKGDIIGLVEVMKTFNQVKSDVDGTVLSFQADNEEPIMAGDVIADVESE